MFSVMAIVATLSYSTDPAVITLHEAMAPWRMYYQDSINSVSIRRSAKPCCLEYGKSVFSIRPNEFQMLELSGGLGLVSRREGDAFNLWSIAPGQKETQLTHFPDGYVQSEVSPCQTRVAIRDHSGQWFVCNILEACVAPVPLKGDQVIWDQAGHRLAYVDERGRASLWELDKNLGQVVYSPVVSSVAVPRCFSHKGDVLLVEESSQARIVEIELSSGVVRQLPRKSKAGPYYALGYSSDDTHIIFETRSKQTIGSDGFVRRARDSGKAKWITKGLLGLDRRYGARSRYDSSSNTIVGVINKRGGHGIKAWNAKSGRVIGEPILPLGAVHGKPVIRNNKVGFAFSTWDSPISVYVWDLGQSKGTPERRASVESPKVPGIVLSTMYPSGGAAIPTYVYLPACRRANAKSPLPFVLYLHGGPFSQHLPSFDRDILAFIAAGYGVVAMNYRGSSGYGDLFMDADNGEGREAPMLDIVEAAEWLIKSGLAKRGKIALCGQSYGGYAGLLVASRAPGLFAAVYAGSPITDLNAYIASREQPELTYKQYEYGMKSDIELLTKWSPRTHIKSLKVPILITHGARDRQIPVAQTDLFVQEALAAGVDVQYMRLDEEAHSIRNHDTYLKTRRAMLELFDKHLGPNDSPTSRPAPLSSAP